VADETFDVGGDMRSPVNDADYQLPFDFTGKINKLTFKIGPQQLSAVEQEQQRRASLGSD
jgi:arylsulfatase